MLLTGTFGQYRALVPSVENGYFSRLLTVTVIRWNDAWQERGQVKKIEYGYYRKVKLNMRL